MKVHVSNFDPNTDRAAPFVAAGIALEHHGKGSITLEVHTDKLTHQPTHQPSH